MLMLDTATTRSTSSCLHSQPGPARFAILALAPPFTAARARSSWDPRAACAHAIAHARARIHTVHAITRLVVVLYKCLTFNAKGPFPFKFRRV